MKKYTLENILLGLNNEYINYKENLENLKKLIIINNPSLIENTKLYVNEKWDMKEPKLILEIYRKLNKLELLYTKLTKTNNINKIELSNGIFEYGKLKIDYSSNIFIKEYYKFMNTDFVKYIYLWGITNNMGSLTIEHNSINYYSFKDKMNFTIDPINNTTNFVCNDILKLEFDKQKFSNYHQKLIEQKNKKLLELKKGILIYK